ncbi:MAG: hypothetical protein WBG30_07800 [Psychrilyobacter sp.]
MSDAFKAIFSVLMMGILATILRNNDLEVIMKLVIFYLGVKEIPKIFL